MNSVPWRPTFLERAEEVPPVGLSFAQGDADAEDGSVAGGIDADGHQEGAIEDHTVAADLLVAGIEQEVGTGDFVERAVAPEIELLIELSGRATDLRSGDLQGAGELAEDARDPARGDALDVHLGDREGQSAFAAQPALQSRGIEVELAANLGDIDRQLAEP